MTTRKHRASIGPIAVGDVLSNLLARRGYTAQQAADQCYEAWCLAVGDQLARDTHVGRVRDGVLEVFARSSPVVQELTFQKTQIINKLTKIIPGQSIRDIRIRVGGIN